MINFDEVLSYLGTPHKTVFDLIDDRDYTKNYRLRRLFFPQDCPICHRRKNVHFKVVKVFSLTGNQWKPYITPICNNCCDKYSKYGDMNNKKEFFVQRYFLCGNPR